MYGITSDTGSAISTWNVEIVGHAVSRSRSGVPDVRKACERRQRQSSREALVQFIELVRLFNRQPKDKGQIQHSFGVMLGLVDKSEEVVVGTIEGVVKARVVCRMPAEQGG